jgi:hypothetical protein
MARLLLPKLANPLVFPGGNAGFDPNHPASQNNWFSFVSGLNGGPVLVNGPGVTVRPTLAGTPTTKIDGRVGPIFKTVGTTDLGQFVGINSSNNPGNDTMAAIYRVDANNGSAQSQIVMSDDAGTGNAGLGMDGFNDSTSSISVRQGTIITLTGAPTIVFGVPYFFAFSINKNSGVTLPISWVLRRLDTGQIWSGQVADSNSLTAGAGAVTIGNRSSGSRQLDGGVAAGMRSHIVLTLQQLLEWADHPWQFWYQSDATKATSVVGPNTASVSVTEAASAADSPSAVNSTISTTAEAATAADSPTTAITFAAAESEAGAGSDGTSATNTAAGSVADGLGATDNPAAVNTTPATVSEAGSGADTASAANTAVATVSEAVNSADSPSASNSTAATVSEAASAADSSSPTAFDASAAAEAVSAADVPTGANVTAASAIEAASAADSLAAGGSETAEDAEAVSAADNTNAANVTAAAANEAAGASDAPIALAVYVGPVADGLAVSDNPAAINTTGAAVTEAASAADGVDASVTKYAAVMEIVAAGDIVLSHAAKEIASMAVAVSADRIGLMMDASAVEIDDLTSGILFGTKLSGAFLQIKSTSIRLDIEVN